MTKMVFTRIIDGICVSDDSAVDASKRGFERLVYIQSCDYALRRVAIPPSLTHAERRDYVALKIASLFPVSQGSSFDIVTGSNARFANVVLIGNGALEALRARFPKAVFTNGACALACAPNDGFRLVSYADWMELYTIKDGAVIELARVERFTDLETALARIMDGLSGGEGAPLHVVCDSERAQAISAALSRMGFTVLAVSPLESLTPTGRESRGIFARERPHVVPPHVLSIICVAAVAIALNVAMVSLKAAYARRFEAASAFIKESNQTVKKISDLKKRRLDLESKATEASQERAFSPYSMLSSIVAACGGGLKLERVTIDDHKFNAEAVARDSLSILRKLEGSGIFAQVSVRNIVPLSSGEESFSITGTAR